MENSLALPTALRQLQEQIRQASEPAAVLQALRALQFSGMTREEIVVHLERGRMRNSLEGDDEAYEENALLALDMVRGQTRAFNLLWDSAEIAKVFVPRVLDRATLVSAMPMAFTPNDLLPTKPDTSILRQLQDVVVTGELEVFQNFEYRPKSASFFRVPKGGFGTRPAAVLYPADRLAYEALALVVQPALSDQLNQFALWPRRPADDVGVYDEFGKAPSTWTTSTHVIRLDIESFYESINHSLLSVFLREHFDLRRDYLLSIEGLLGAVMGSGEGLPQGVPASDVFAAAFLAPLDSFLSENGWSFVRYVDDILIGADSFLDGRLKLEKVESTLGDLGLRLNTAKTDILRIETYARNLSKSRPRLERFARAMGEDARNQLLAAEDKDELSELLEGFGVEEETLWDLLYHNSIDLDDVIERVRSSLEVDDEDSQIRAQYVASIAQSLRENQRPTDVSMSEVEGDLRECLVFLSGARLTEAIDDVRLLQEWFPGLAPYVSAYLVACAEDAPHEVTRFLYSWVVGERDSDWVNATLCNAFEKRASLVSARIGEDLSQLVVRPGSGALTRAVAVRALAVSGQLTQRAFADSLRQLPASLGLELMLTARARPDLYPLGGLTEIPIFDRNT